MNAREFFFVVSEMRSAQRRYFKTHDPNLFRAVRALENKVDREIARVNEILANT